MNWDNVKIEDKNSICNQAAKICAMYVSGKSQAYIFHEIVLLTVKIKKITGLDVEMINCLDSIQDICDFLKIPENFLQELKTI